MIDLILGFTIRAIVVVNLALYLAFWISDTAALDVGYELVSSWVFAFSLGIA